MTDTGPPAITRSDFAALRAWIQGIAPDQVAARYLVHAWEDEAAPDARLVARYLAAMHEALRLRARQHGRDDLAAALASLDRGSNRSVDRAVAAITQIERLGTPCPAPHQAVSMWFAPALAGRLRQAGLGTIDALVRHCNRHGRTWWRQVPRVGAKAAGAIGQWLRTHGGALVAAGGQTVAPYVTGEAAPVAPAPLAPRASFVPPFERMAIAHGLDGAAGVNRGDGSPALAASNDYEAVNAWLSLRPPGSETRRAYRKEAERFMAWAIVERGKPLSSLLVEDCIAYRDWLADPQPAERWCGPMAARFCPLWRPFTGPLSDRSRDYAVTVLRSLCEWLTRLRYLAVNPWDGVPAVQTHAPPMRIDKALSVEAWSAFEAWLRERAMQEDASDARTAHTAILTLRDTGLRRAELCAADRAAAVPAPGLHAAVWGELHVLGKGGKLRAVPLSEAAVEALRAHWRDRGEDFDTATEGPLLRPVRRPSTPRAIAAATAGRGFSPSGLHALISRAAQAYAAARPNEVGVGRLRAHGLRHTFGVQGTEAGVPADVLQAIFGHASPATTGIYNKAPRDRKLREAAKLFAAG
jgi:integrase